MMILASIKDRWHKAVKLRHISRIWFTLMFRRSKLITMSLRNGDRKLTMTFRRSTSDTGILEEVLSSEVYPCSKFYSERSVVIDFGAHIGTFTNNFLINRPLASAICIEPNPFSYALLIQNLQANQVLSRSSCFGAALVSRNDLEADRFVRLDFPRGQSDVFEQFQISPQGRWITLGISLEMITSILEPCVPIVVKMDIEGGELPLLDEFLDFLIIQNVVMLFMEFHGTSAELESWVGRLGSIGFRSKVQGAILRSERLVAST